MYDSTYFTDWEAPISDLLVDDRKGELNFQRCFYTRYNITDPHLLQTPVSVNSAAR